VFGYEDLSDAFDGVAAELKLDRHVGILMGLIDARAHGEFHDIAVEEQSGQAHGGRWSACLRGRSRLPAGAALRQG